MKQGAPTPATLAVILITELCLPTIFEPEAIAGQSPVPGRRLTEEERRKIGLTEPGMTIGYRVDKTDVFFDMAGTQATVWFAGGDFVAAAPLLEARIQEIFTLKALAAREIAPTPGKKTVTREIVIYPVRRSRRAAVLSVTYGPPGAEGEARMFFCRIFPQERVGS
jgi:hypothetical protein